MEMTDVLLYVSSIDSTCSESATTDPSGTEFHGFGTVSPLRIPLRQRHAVTNIPLTSSPPQLTISCMDRTITHETIERSNTDDDLVLVSFAAEQKTLFFAKIKGDTTIYPAFKTPRYFVTFSHQGNVDSFDIGYERDDFPIDGLALQKMLKRSSRSNRMRVFEKSFSLYGIIIAKHQSIADQIEDMKSVLTNLSR